MKRTRRQATRAERNVTKTPAASSSSHAATPTSAPAMGIFSPLQRARRYNGSGWRVGR
jgi:hypothetical protein